jgi:hypothetical protein
VGITTPEGLSGTQAFLWIYNNLPTREAIRSEPKFAFLPRNPPPGFQQAKLRSPAWFKQELARAALARRTP